MRPTKAQAGSAGTGHMTVDESSKLDTETKEQCGNCLGRATSLGQGQVCYSSQGLAGPYQGWCE